MAPAAPVITSPASGAVLTSNTISFAGTSESDGDVHVYAGQNVVLTTTSSAGTWSATGSLADGAYDLWATVSADGEDSPGSENVAVTVSGQPVPSGDPEPAGASAPSDEAPAGDAPPADPPVEPVSPPEAPPVDAPADPAPVEEAPSTEAPSTELPEGSQQPSGGTQVSASTNAVEAAEADPEIPTASTPVERPEPPVIEEPHAGQTLEESLVKVSGTAEPSGATVTAWADSRAIGTASVDDTGNWSLEASLPNGDYELAASVSDTGNTSARSDAITVTVAFDAHAEPVEPPADPDERFALFLREKILRSYPLRWELIADLRGHAENWLSERGL